MGQWKDIPNEILSKITQPLGTSSKQNQWMYDNKQWHALYQSKAFKTISINLQLTDPTINIILNSVFLPGEWAKKITFKTRKAPNKYFGLSPEEDTLSLLMTRCPNIEEVDFPEKNDYKPQDWAYFSVTLTNMDMWRLKILPSIGEKRDLFPYYYTCVQFVQNTLTTLYLAERMLSRNNFRSLKELAQLTVLDIGRDVVRNMKECCSLIQFVPTLKELKVDMFHTRTLAKSIIVQKEGLAAMTFPKIKRLTIDNFASSCDSELLEIINKMTGLEYIRIEGSQAGFWPTKNISSTELFFRFIHTVKSFNINAWDGKDEVQFLETFYNSQISTEK